MVSILVNWLIVSVAVFATANLLPGVKLKDFTSAIWVAAIFGVLNFLLGWLLFTIFTIGTLGLAYLFAFLTWWVINAILLKVTDAMTSSFKVEGVFTTLLAAGLISIFSAVGHWVVAMF